jgi:hypothetical protein
MCFVVAYVVSWDPLISIYFLIAFASLRSLFFSRPLRVLVGSPSSTIVKLIHSKFDGNSFINAINLPHFRT